MGDASQEGCWSWIPTNALANLPTVRQQRYHTESAIASASSRRSLDVALSVDRARTQPLQERVQSRP
eukprot:2733822-Pleurochrysis_carterae.AAC.1